MWDYANQPVRPEASVSSCLHRINDGVVALTKTSLDDTTPEQLEWARSMCDRLLMHLYPADNPTLVDESDTPPSYGLGIGMIEAGSELIGKVPNVIDRESVQRLSRVLDKLQLQWLDALEAEIRGAEKKETK